MSDLIVPEKHRQTSLYTQGLGTNPAQAGPGLELRPYQDEAVQAVFDEADKGVRKQMVVMATGLGKTICFTDLARRMNTRTLILAHRDELIRQAVEKVRMGWPTADIGIVKAEEDEHNAQVVVASVQTLSRDNRLNRLDEPFDLVVVDEAHHSAADSYKKILDRLGCFKSDGPLLVGFTATPDRGDKQGLDSIFDKIVFLRDIKWGIENGYLCDLRAIEVMLKLDLGTVKTSRGDYQDGDLGQHMMEADAPEHIVKAWFDHARERKTLVFSPTVAMAIAVKDEFKRNGVKVAEVNGNTPTDERRAMMSLFDSGEIQVLSNCGVATEGFDCPSIECILNARPTKTRALYTQIVGRGTRKFPGKKDCLILDVTGVAKTHQLITAASLLGVDQREMRKGASAKQLFSAQAAAAEAALRPKAPDGKLVSTNIDLWKQFKEAEFAWVPTQNGYTLSIPNGHVTLMRVSEQGFGVVISRRKDGVDTRNILSITKGGLAIEMAQGIAEDWVRQNGISQLTSRGASWRDKPASEKQKAALRKWKVPVRPDLTAGEASDIMTAKIAGKKSG